MKLQIKVAGAIFLITALILSISYVSSLREENKLLHNNQEVFLDSIQKYKVADSLNAAATNVLVLTNKELKQHLSEDAELIKKLKSGKSEAVIKTISKTEYVIKTEVKDSVVYKDTLKAFQYHNQWTDIVGLLSKDSVDLKIKNKEELLIVENKRKKNFLFFKLPIWLFGYKTCGINVVSKNPNTEIENLEYIQIYK